MNKKRYRIIISISVSIIIIFALIYFKGISKYPMISENATVIKYHDITENNPGNRIKNGVEITYIDGHMENGTHILLDDYKPYKRLEMYESNGTFIIIYDEEKEGNKKDRFLSLKGWPGYKSSNEYKVEVYKNGKRVRNVKVYNAEE